MRIGVVVVALLLLTGEAYAAPNIEMVFVKGGCYQMGDTFGDGDASEKPVHQVCVDDFYIGRYVVTQAQWQAVMGNNPSYFSQCGPDCPVEHVSWDNAQEFIRRLNYLTGRNYRLPYEAEWEYAARSGGGQERWAGTSNPFELRDYAWFGKNSRNRTHPVGTRRPNGLGLYDMSGNVWEWCQDWYDNDYYKTSPRDNPRGPQTGVYRVLRGGGWNDSAGIVRASMRFNEAPFNPYGGDGFRLVLPETRTSKKMVPSP